ncbi:PLP-dependent aminotransferase family protein [Bacillus sp. ISL-51]|uniref:MocR-like pyridoxine biosynthesis transcription factor PdxR n=1 Tax=Bacteria TaxID=2 RepID=UPI001BE7A25C|nr:MULTISPECIES: PLP-dependent aminotransferase family protein [Bacteria]MBT2573907.1 PLP-dependent aminotransferase family protein [Bacillus sp. ISL-51]MBT2634761.1 PLP-dependent aminotransferase family protein [Bacillus sp. ISL-26]MBT2712237.1 PLP-dependent aminotransferase family protein [Pseudomonas sp. ISL-88]
MLEFTPLLVKKNGIPIYVQLYQYIRQKIEDGDIPEGALLPSIRYLSGHLHISKNTVENAYQQLAAEGYAESKPRSGLVVLPLEQPVVLPSSRNIRQKPEAAEDEKENIICDFRYGDIDVKSFPMQTWKRCLNQALTDEPEKLLLSNHGKGDIGLRTELSGHLFQARGVLSSPEQIIICSGTQQALSLMIQLLSFEDRSVAMENPGYAGARSVFINHGWTVKPIRLEQDGIDIEQLKRIKAKAVYITPSHQFPYGMVLPIQKRLSLLEWANQHDSYIIEDDYDSEFRYQGRPIPSLKALDAKDNVIYLGTVSKSFLPAARLSYIVLPQKLLDVYDHTFINYSQSASPIIQKALYLFMKEGYFKSHIRKMRKIYQKKHQTLIQALQNQMGRHIEIIGQKAGLHLLVNVKDRSAPELVDKAQAAGVRVYDTSPYWINPKEPETSMVILGFGGLSEEEIEEGICQLRKAWFPFGA